MWRRTTVVVLLAAAGLLTWFQKDEPVAAPPPEPARAPMVMPGLRPGPTTTSEQTVLDVYLSLGDHADEPSVDEQGYAPWVYWPRLGEADWPDLETTEAMDALVDELNADDQSALMSHVARFVEAAEDDGLLPLPSEGFEDPWTGLMAARAAYAAVFLMDDEDEEQIVEMLAARHQLVAGILEAEPQPEVANLAGLILTSGGRMLQDHELPDGSRVDAEEVAQAVTEVLRQADHPAMIREAAELAALQGGEEVLDELERVLPRAGDQDSAVARVALGVAIRTGRWEDAATWAQTLEEAADVSDDDLARVDRARGRLAARGLGDAGTWRAELYAAAWRCEERVPVEERQVLTWDIAGTEWTFQEVSSPLAACLGSFQPETPGPSDARVVFTLVRPQ